MEAARAKLKAEYRQAQEPVVAGQPSAAPPPPAPPAQAPAASPAAPPANALAEAFTAQLNKQFEEASRMRTEAQQISQTAEQRAAAAEAKLKQFIDNPVAYLQEQGKTLDEWNARLQNGGEPTELEKLKDELRKELKAETAPVAEQLAALRQQTIQQERTKAIQSMDALAPQYPLLAKLDGSAAIVDGYLQHVQQAASAKRQPVEFGKFLADREAFHESRLKPLLQDKTAASKLGVSAPSSPGTVVAQSPSTMTNRVTSTVPSSPARAANDRDRILRGRETLKRLLAEGKL